MEKSTAMVFGLSGYTAAEGAAGAKPATGDASFRHEATPRVEWAGALAEVGGDGKAGGGPRATSALLGKAKNYPYTVAPHCVY